jgi:hypothetical protein
VETGILRFHPFEERRVDFTIEPRDPRALYVYPIEWELPPGARVIAVVTGLGGRPVVSLIDFPAVL